MLQHLTGLIKRLVGADHHLRVAIDFDFRFRALSQNPASRYNL